MEETLQRLGEVDSVFRRLHDVDTCGPIWDRLVTQYRILGAAVHDAQLVASMLAHGIVAILTLNGADFRRYSSEITILHPRDLSSNLISGS